MLHPWVESVRIAFQQAENPQWVIEFIQEHQEQLSGLSKREALKLLQQNEMKKKFSAKSGHRAVIS